ncbi:hypothetical protein WBG78_18285 [Chryseolinea sp. T2]|uniref:hypothetical protein n=1 Tax=Chryseolinea sp. T2 TaxID=3129255 RepID=UPI0030786A5F
MKTSWDELALIERYLDGELSTTELTVFENRLDKEPLLKADVKVQTAVRTLVKRHYVLKMRSQAKELHAHLYNDPARRSMRQAIEALFK